MAGYMNGVPCRRCGSQKCVRSVYRGDARVPLCEPCRSRPKAPPEAQPLLDLQPQAAPWRRA